MGKFRKGEIDITRKEKIYNICCRIMCFIPFIFTIISEELGIPDNIKNFIWLIMFMVCIILVLVALTIFKDKKRSERFLGVLSLLLIIGYTIYFVLF